MAHGLVSGGTGRAASGGRGTSGGVAAAAPLRGAPLRQSRVQPGQDPAPARTPRGQSVTAAAGHATLARAAQASTVASAAAARGGEAPRARSLSRQTRQTARGGAAAERPSARAGAGSSTDRGGGAGGMGYPPWAEGPEGRRPSGGVAHGGAQVPLRSSPSPRRPRTLPGRSSRPKRATSSSRQLATCGAAMGRMPARPPYRRVPNLRRRAPRRAPQPAPDWVLSPASRLFQRKRPRASTSRRIIQTQGCAP